MPSARPKSSAFTTKRTFAASAVTTPNPITGAPRLPYRVVRDRLGNGLQVVTVETPHLHTASIALYVRAGSRYETPSTNGLSHFVEHMLFRGSASHPSSLALNSAIEDLGGTLYAETGRDYSLYQVSVAPREVPRALAILGNLFLAPLFTDIDLERQIILEELLEDVDEHGRNVNIDDLSRQAAYTGQPLGYPIIGPARNVRRFTAQDVRTHFERLYHAGNMVLALGGRLRASQVLPAVERTFGPLPSGPPSRPQRARISRRGPVCRTIATDSPQTQVALLFHGLPDADPDYAAQMALSRLIDDGMATPLHYRVCDQKGLAYSIGAEIEPLHDTSLFDFAAACAPGKLLGLLDEVFAILREFRARPADPTVLMRVKRRYRDQLESSYDDVDSLCGWFGGTALFYPPKSHEERARRMDAVTASDVQRVARRIFAPSRLVVVVTGAVDAALGARVRRRLTRFPGSS